MVIYQIHDVTEQLLGRTLVLKLDEKTMKALTFACFWSKYICHYKQALGHINSLLSAL